MEIKTDFSNFKPLPTSKRLKAQGSGRKENLFVALAFILDLITIPHPEIDCFYLYSD
jgi:hypothetical protein